MDRNHRTDSKDRDPSNHRTCQNIMVSLPVSSEPSKEKAPSSSFDGPSQNGASPADSIYSTGMDTLSHSRNLLNTPNVMSTPSTTGIGGSICPKERLRLLLEEPSSSATALSVSIFIAITIVLSSIAVIIETLPQFYRAKDNYWFMVETSIVVCFTIELALRSYAHSSSRRLLVHFLTSLYTIIDIASILPYYAEFFLMGKQLGELRRFTVLRLFRLIRLARCYQYSSLLQVSINSMVIAVHKSSEALLAIVIFLSLIVVVFSTLIYFAERGTYDPIKKQFIDIDGQPSRFDSIPATFWFVLEIITTVGLGDIVPKTIWGKLISFPLMLLGLLIIALPSIVIGRNFAEAWTLLRSFKRSSMGTTIDNSIVEELKRDLFIPNINVYGDSTLVNTSKPMPRSTPTAQATKNPSEFYPYEQSKNLVAYLDLQSTTIREKGGFDSTERLTLSIQLQRQNELLERLLHRLESIDPASFPS